MKQHMSLRGETMHAHLRSVQFTGVALVALLSLSACGSENAQAGGSGEEQVELNLAYWGGGLRVEQTDAIIVC